MPIKNNKNAEQLWGKDIDTPSSSDDNKVMVYNADTDSYEYSNQFADYHSLTQTISYTHDEERRFFKDDFSVDSSDQYTVIAGSMVYDTDHFEVSTNSYLYPKLFEEKPCYKFRVRVKQPGCTGTMTNGVNHVQYILGGTTPSTYNSNYVSRICVVTYNADTNTNSLGIAISTLTGAIQYGTTIKFADTTEYYAFLESGYTLEVYINAAGKIVVNIPEKSYSVTSTFAIDTTQLSSFRILTTGLNTQIELYDFAVSSSESYSDDFTTDTVSGANGRYQAITGSNAYDDVNKRMTVTTATGANGKASGRLKSYKFCEGSQIFDVTLPTGADGDFITLVTHSANGLMTDGIGVGLQSDGAGNWNLATLSGTTVTEGADSGLDDADVARIEIEKDLSGAYWYYIYDAAGAKPATPTGKLFTTLSEGYTGWYANGAGATTQTYAIDNISIRAESIVGRTNVELTEEVFNSVTGQMETRTYFKPIHRGAMLETFWDGTQEVVGTTFIDDCQWDRSAEYTVIRGTLTHDAINGCLKLSNASYGGAVEIKGLQMSGGFIHLDFANSTGLSEGIVFGWDGQLNSSNYYPPLNGIRYFRADKSRWRLTEYTNGTSTALISKDVDPSLFRGVNILWDNQAGKVYLWHDGEAPLKYEVTNPNLIKPYSKVGLTTYGTSSDAAVKFYNVQIIAASPDATTGIAACIPPIGGGARYDTQESITQTIDMSGIVSSDLKAYSSAISTNAAETALLRITAKNDTDDTSVYSDGTTKYWDVVMDGTVINTRKALETNFNDMGDSVVFTHSTDAGVPDGCIYVRETICKPITIVMEEDLT